MYSARLDGSLTWQQPPGPILPVDDGVSDLLCLMGTFSLEHILLGGHEQLTHQWKSEGYQRHMESVSSWEIASATSRNSCRWKVYGSKKQNKKSQKITE